MIALDSDTAIAIKSATPEPVALLTLHLPTVERIASLPYDLVLGGYTWVAGHVLMGTVSAQRQRTLAQDTFTIVFAGKEYATKFKMAGYVGVKMELETAFKKADGSWTTPVHAQTGFSSDMVTEVDDEDGLTTVIEFRDILSIAAGERARYATDENQRRLHATDDSLKYAHRAERFLWGAKAAR